MSLGILRNLLDSAAKTTKQAAQEAVAEGREVTTNLFGVDVVLKYEGEHGRGNVTVYSGLFLDGERYGLEIEYHPWALGKGIELHYEFGGMLQKEEAEALVRKAGLVVATDKAVAGAVILCEDPYPDDDKPLLYFMMAADLDDVVKIFKAWKGLP